ncbi:MAG: hemin uptake protein HemP [Campylobacterales bacterium]
MAKEQNNEHSSAESAFSDDIRKPIVISSENIFGNGSFVYIEHGGQQYILRITRENKLILTK